MPDKKQYRLNKTVWSVVSLDEADDEKNYWRAKNPSERPQALEIMRQIIF